jgi:hypothetical protein
MARLREGYTRPMLRVQRMRLLAACAVFSTITVTGCTGKPASVASWQSSSDRAIGEALSGLGTARLAIKLETRDRAPHTYTVVTVTDAIESSSKEVSSYQVAQPPDSLHRANKVVGQALDDAVSLMVDVRVALASPGLTAASARGLVARIDALRKKLDDLDSAVTTSPGSVGSS